MTMARFRRVTELWNWLPGFRAVAEHESINAAAGALNISASALSRTVKLLESALGAELFVRKGTGLALTQLGGELLALTRDVMRQVDDCIARDERRRGGTGPFYVGVASELAGAVVARALATRVEGVVHVVRVADESAADELLHGNLDLVVTTMAARPANLVGKRIGEVQFGVFAARAQDVGGCAWIAVRGMPELADAEVAVRCESIDIALTLCETSSRACVLPDIGWPSLVRLADAGQPVALDVLHRTPLPTGDDVRLATLVARLAAVLPTNR